MGKSEAGGPITINSELAAIWQRDEGTTLALSQATHAFTVLARLLQPDDQIWVPAYFCENGLGPARAGGRLRLYPVTEAMSPDWMACEAMLADGPPRLFVLPHFFGVENEGKAARAFCDGVGALLLEDAAHVLLPVGEIGRYGDFVTYSPRKFLPVPDGGLLVVRGAGLAERVLRAAADLPHGEVPLLRWRALEWRERLLPRRELRGPLGPRAIDDEPARSADLPAIWQSRFSKRRMEALGPPGIAGIAGRQLAVVGRIIEAMASFTELQPLPRHPDAVPYMLGFRASSVPAAAEALARLRAAGAVVETWPGMPPEVWAEPNRYGAALELRRTILRFAPRRRGRRTPLRFIENLPALREA